MPESPSANSTALQFDAFLSYSRADGAAVRRIQRFLESYRPPGRSSGLKVYLDQTDMRGGSLPENLTTAIGQSRALVVCWSDNAARSQWVNAEIAAFRKLGRPGDIAVMHVAGDGPTVTHEAFAGLTPIEHDLRDGWLGWFLKSRAKIELLRLIAFLTNVEMRVLHNWARQRQLRNVAIGAAVALLPVIGVLSITQPHWESVATNLTYDDAPAQPLACEVVDDKLWVAAWSESAEDNCSGTCDFFVAYPDVFGQPAEAVEQGRTFRLAKRALPEPLVDQHDLGRIMASLNENGLTAELAKEILAGPPRIAQPRPGWFVFIQPIALPEPDPNAPPVSSKLSEPETGGALVATGRKDSTPTLTKVESLSPPLWKERISNTQKSSPASAISVVWQGNDEIWIGVTGERKAPGGLWHSPDGGGSWEKVKDFVSVTSLDLVTSPDGKETLLVAEDNFMHLVNTSNVPGSARVMERADDDRWVPADAPPHGSDSKIEICGTLPDGSLTIRVDGRIYQKSSRSLLRSVLEGFGL
jgi:hypothetical protein